MTEESHIDLNVIRWRCRWGVKELDVLFEKYLTEQFPHDDAETQAAFAKLLEVPAPVVLDYVSGFATPRDPPTQKIIEAISSGY